MQLNYPAIINRISKANGKKRNSLKPNHIKRTIVLEVRQVILQKDLWTFFFDKKMGGEAEYRVLFIRVNLKK